MSRAENLLRQIGDLENKSQSLETTVDRLKAALDRNAEEDGLRKTQMQQLNVTLTDHTATIAEMQDRVSQLQRLLTSSEQDRRVLQERLDTTRSFNVTAVLSSI